MSLRKCINEFCKSCIYDKHAEGAWREQVTRCTSYNCPLYQVRPVTKAGKSAAKTAKTETI